MHSTPSIQIYTSFFGWYVRVRPVGTKNLGPKDTYF